MLYHVLDTHLEISVYAISRVNVFDDLEELKEKPQIHHQHRNKHIKYNYMYL